MSHIDITAKNFTAEVMEYKGKVLVDFWASWCGPCQMLIPIIDQLSEELKDKVKIAKVNIEDNQDLATKFNVQSIPTVLIFENGNVVDTLMGLRPKEEYLKALK